MGGGGKDSSPQVVGYSYFMSFAYAFCDRTDKIIGFMRDNRYVWQGDISTSESSFTALLGKYGTTHTNHSPPATVTYYKGDQTTVDTTVRTPWSTSVWDFSGIVSSSETLAAKSNCLVPYKNTTYIYVNNGFIGDNVQTLPVLHGVFTHTSLETGLPFEHNGVGVNPVAAVYYILKTFAHIEDASIDIPSFIAASNTLGAEDIYLNFVMTSDKKTIEWCSWVLDHVDGYLYFDSSVGKFFVTLVRDDYVVENLVEITDGDILEVKMERPSWNDTYTSFVFKYTDASLGYKEASYEIVNTAAKSMLGFDKVFRKDLMGINDLATLEKLTTNIMRKLSYPVATFKLTLSLIDFPELHVGDVVKFTSASLNLSTVMRITEIGANGEADFSIDIVGVEDVFSLGDSMTLPTVTVPDDSLDYTITNFGDNFVKYLPLELKTVDSSVFTMSGGADGADISISATATGDPIVYTPAPIGIGVASTQVVLPVATENNIDLVTTIEFTPTRNIFTATASDDMMFTGGVLAFIGNELISVREITYDGGTNKATITGFLRNLGNTVHDTGTIEISDPIYIMYGVDATQLVAAEVPILPSDTSIVMTAKNPLYTVNVDVPVSVDNLISTYEPPEVATSDGQNVYVTLNVPNSMGALSAAGDVQTDIGEILVNTFGANVSVELYTGPSVGSLTLHSTVTLDTVTGPEFLFDLGAAETTGTVIGAKLIAADFKVSEIGTVVVP